MNEFTYRCLKCSQEYESSDNELLTCPKCGSNLDVIYDYDSIDVSGERVMRDMFLFSQLMPVDSARHLLRHTIGGTPLIESRNSKGLYFKDDSRLPSLSFKDRASAVAILRAHYFAIDTIVTASTGNAAASLSVLCAAAGKKAVIFAPASAPEGKLLQILIHGARLVKVEGTYDEAFDIATEFSRHTGAYLRSTGINPMMTEGKKTAAFEIFHQMKGVVPDNVIVSVGDGCIIGAAYKGFHELVRIGAADKVPRIFGIQAEGSAPLVEAFNKNTYDIEPIVAKTIADSISVGHPRDARKALRAAFESGGKFISVSDNEIMDAQSDLAREEGVFCEPAASAAYAGFKKLNLQGTTCVYVTGNGLKDPSASLKSNSFEYISVDPSNVDYDKIKESIES